jgi:hypothetical protein
MTPEAKDSDGFLTEKDAARLLSLSFRTLQSWRRKNIGPKFIKFGRSVRYARQALFLWAEAHAK